MNRLLQTVLTSKNPYIVELYQDTSRFKIHMHHSVEVIYVVKGSLDIIIDFKKYAIPKNHVVFINSLVPHSVFKSTNTEVIFYCIQFLPELVYCYGNDYINTDFFLWFSAKMENIFSVFEIPVNSEIEVIIKNAYLLYLASQPGNEFKVQAQIFLLCDFLYNNHPLGVQKIQSLTNEEALMIKKVFDYVESNYNITIEKTLNKFFFTTESDSQLFQQVTGYRIDEYCEHYRFNLAKLQGTWNKLSNANSEMPQIIKTNIDRSMIRPYIQMKQPTVPYHKRWVSARIENSITKSWAIHRFSKVIFVSSGEGILEVRGFSVLLRPGSMVFLYPSERYRFTKFSEKMEVLFLQFYHQVLSFGKLPNPWSRNLQKIPLSSRINICIYDMDNRTLADSYDALYSRRLSLNCESDHFLRAQCFQVVSWLLEKQESIVMKSAIPNQYSPSSNVIKIIDYVNEHYTENLKLLELSERFGVSYSYLSRKFKELTGQSFNQYINEKRLSHANNLLGISDYSIRKIAMILGYCRRSHFTEQYSKLYGITPLEFRERMKLQQAEDVMFSDK